MSYKEKWETGRSFLLPIPEENFVLKVRLLQEYSQIAAGSIAVFTNTVGHSDVKTAMTYQHPKLNIVRDVVISLFQSRS